MSSQFNVISTFAGCGGSSLGYKMAGGKVLLAVEWDDHAAETYKMNHPGTHFYHGDIAKLSVEQILEMTGLQPGELDIFDGSPPCQGFSMSNMKRLLKETTHSALKDPRNYLFLEYCRILKGLQPKVFVMENVSGMVKGKMKLIFAEILTELKKCGYKVKVKKMNAKYYGVPQARERMIFIGVREDLGIEPSHPKPQTAPITVKKVLEGMPDIEFQTMKGLALEIWKKLKPGQSMDEYHPKGHWFNGYKIGKYEPAKTITKQVFVGGQAGLFHYKYPRPLTIDELKRVASFPDDFTFPGDYNTPLNGQKDFRDAWGRIGNAVPPLLMKAIATHIKENILSKIHEHV